jgi:hypothetical protein
LVAVASGSEDDAGLRLVWPAAAASAARSSLAAASACAAETAVWTLEDEDGRLLIVGGRPGFGNPNPSTSREEM